MAWDEGVMACAEVGRNGCAQCDTGKAAQVSKWVHGGRRSKPWDDDEYMLVDGLRCTYSVLPNGIVVHMPGSRTIPILVVRANFVVIDPRRWRVESYE